MSESDEPKTCQGDPEVRPSTPSSRRKDLASRRRETTAHDEGGQRDDPDVVILSPGDIRTKRILNMLPAKWRETKATDTEFAEEALREAEDEIREALAAAARLLGPTESYGSALGKVMNDDFNAQLDIRGQAMWIVYCLGRAMALLGST